MKRTFLILSILILSVAFVAAQSVQYNFNSMGGWQSASGNWRVRDGRLCQLDTKERIAKINLRVPQSGTVQYEFNVRYEAGGFEDRMGGFGIHIFADSAHPGRSWGMGRSYLLWINYDEKATYGKPGFRAQVYRSHSHSKMEIIERLDVGLPTSVLTRENASVIVPAKIVVNGNTGEVKVYDPVDPTWVYKFNLDGAPGRGNYVALRTNSLSVSFDDFKVTQLR
ncbi:MAG: hypothetical protein DRP87_10525 [Spirochaetes bacterium]|nr:MAG: hypothetical protein DRP87_10525 [Spirochaetota bacterium]